MFTKQYIIFPCKQKQTNIKKKKKNGKNLVSLMTITEQSTNSNNNDDFIQNVTEWIENNLIVSIIIGASIILLILLCVIYCCCCRKLTKIEKNGLFFGFFCFLFFLLLFSLCHIFFFKCVFFFPNLQKSTSPISWHVTLKQIVTGCCCRMRVKCALNVSVTNVQK